MMKVVMANLMPNIFIAIGVASIAYFLSHSLPDLWKSAVCATIVPRYLFIAVNSIIIIVWKLHGVQHHHDDHHKSYSSSSSTSSSLVSHHILPSKLMDYHANSSDLSDVFETNEIKQAVGIDNDQSSFPCPPDHPPPLENDTMDAMWKAIMGGGTSPDKNQNLKKSDTSAMLVRSSAAVVGQHFVKSNTFRDAMKMESPPRKQMRKSKTFGESSSSSSSLSSPSPATAAAPATGWRGREQLVMGRDELFGKVEAFIKMNYDQLRLQRQESEQRYVQMVNAA